jgi:hypothetical protein
LARYVVGVKVIDSKSETAKLNDTLDAVVGVDEKSLSTTTLLFDAS